MAIFMKDSSLISSRSIFSRFTNHLPNNKYNLLALLVWSNFFTNIIFKSIGSITHALHISSLYIQLSTEIDSAGSFYQFPIN